MNDDIFGKVLLVSLVGFCTLSYMVGCSVGSWGEKITAIQCEQNSTTLADYRKCMKGDNK